MTQGGLSFQRVGTKQGEVQYEREKSEAGMTAGEGIPRGEGIPPGEGIPLGGLPVYLDLAQVMGLRQSSWSTGIWPFGKPCLSLPGLGWSGRSEEAHSVIKEDLGGKLPSGKFGVRVTDPNAVWWWIMVLALNLNQAIES